MSLPNYGAIRRHGLHRFGDRVPVVAPEVVFVRRGTARPREAFLYTSGKEKTVVCIMHPRADMTRHYAVPDIVENGLPFMRNRDGFRETMCRRARFTSPWLPTSAAGMVFLKSRGFEHIILLGNSGRHRCTRSTRLRR